MANKKYDDVDPFFCWKYVLVLVFALILSIPMGLALAKIDIGNTLWWAYCTLVG